MSNCAQCGSEFEMTSGNWELCYRCQHSTLIINSSAEMSQERSAEDLGRLIENSAMEFPPRFAATADLEEIDEFRAMLLKTNGVEITREEAARALKQHMNLQDLGMSIVLLVLIGIFCLAFLATGCTATVANPDGTATQISIGQDQSRLAVDLLGSYEGVTLGNEDRRMLNDLARVLHEFRRAVMAKRWDRARELAQEMSRIVGRMHRNFHGRGPRPR